MEICIVLYYTNNIRISDTMCSTHYNLVILHPFPHAHVLPLPEVDDRLTNTDGTAAVAIIRNQAETSGLYTADCLLLEVISSLLKLVDDGLLLLAPAWQS